MKTVNEENRLKKEDSKSRRLHDKRLNKEDSK